MVDNALGAMVNNALGTKWYGGEMVDLALWAKWHLALQASVTITHTANVPLNPGRHLSSSQVGVIGGDAIEVKSLIRI